MKSLESIRNSARAKSAEIARANSAREAEEHARKVEIARRERAIMAREGQLVTSVEEAEESFREAMAGIKPWETMVSVTRNGVTRHWRE